jgi:CheY-like chemotaxis protein
MKPHLLLVDDDRDELSILSGALKEAGNDCKCTWATSPHQALDMLHYLHPDFIFMDYNMPKMNGIECIIKIRELKRCNNIPVILYSSELSDTLIKLARESGAQFYLRKTSDPASFNRQLKKIFSEMHLLPQ